MESVVFMAAECRRRGIRFLLNAAPAARLDPSVLAACDPLVVNETEALFLLGGAESDDPIEQARALLARGPKSVVITLGAAGSVAVTAQGAAVSQSAPPVVVVDTTGAGDGFVGALATVLADGGDLAEGLALGTAVSGRAVQRFGAQASYPRRQELA